MTDDEDDPEARVIFERENSYRAASVLGALRELLATMSRQAADHLPDFLALRPGTALVAIAGIDVSNGERFEIQLKVRRVDQDEARG
jgi:hypothetical protein